MSGREDADWLSHPKFLIFGVVTIQIGETYPNHIDNSEISPWVTENRDFNFDWKVRNTTQLSIASLPRWSIATRIAIAEVLRCTFLASFYFELLLNKS
jgi:hypothetical protein